MNAWKGTLKIHDTMGDNRLRFANRLNEMGEELASLAKEVDKNRKQVCDYPQCTCLVLANFSPILRVKSSRRGTRGLCRSLR